MRLFVKIILGFFLFLIIAGIAAFIYFNKKFTPEENYLTLCASTAVVPIEWGTTKNSSMASLMLPVQLAGVPHTFYMQFDTGTPSTLFRKERIAAIQKKYTDALIDTISTPTRVGLSFHLGALEIKSDKFRLLDRGSSTIDWKDTSRTYVIGTIGADLIEKKITVVDFKNNRCIFADTLTADYEVKEWYPLKFVKRKVLFPAVVAGRKAKLVHDTGSSGFELITSKKIWTRLAKPGAQAKAGFEVKSWDRTLTAYNIASAKSIDFKMKTLPLNKVTYIEGAAAWQIILMRLTGMGGMIGNEILKDQVLVMDCKNKQYSILD